jgi:hypothetical protein
MVERVLGAIFENATPPTKAYVTRWGSDPCESARVERESESESQSQSESESERERERERKRRHESARVCSLALLILLLVSPLSLSLRSCLLSRSPHTTICVFFFCRCAGSIRIPVYSVRGSGGGSIALLRLY